METTVQHTTETVGGKEYPLAITRQRGLQEITVQGQPVLAEAVTIFESPLGTSRCYTRAGSEALPEDRAANRRQIQEIAARAMTDMGIW